VILGLSERAAPVAPGAASANANDEVEHGTLAKEASQQPTATWDAVGIGSVIGEGSEY